MAVLKSTFQRISKMALGDLFDVHTMAGDEEGQEVGGSLHTFFKVKKTKNFFVLEKKFLTNNSISVKKHNDITDDPDGFNLNWK